MSKVFPHRFVTNTSILFCTAQFTHTQTTKLTCTTTTNSTSAIVPHPLYTTSVILGSLLRTWRFRGRWSEWQSRKPLTLVLIWTRRVFTWLCLVAVVMLLLLKSLARASRFVFSIWFCFCCRRCDCSLFLYICLEQFLNVFNTWINGFWFRFGNHLYTTRWVRFRSSRCRSYRCVGWWPLARSVDSVLIHDVWISK